MAFSVITSATTERLKSELDSAKVKLVELEDSLIQAIRHNEELYERNSDLGIQLENALEENANLRGEMAALELQQEDGETSYDSKKNFLNNEKGSIDMELDHNQNEDSGSTKDRHRLEVDERGKYSRNDLTATEDLTEMRTEDDDYPVELNLEEGKTEKSGEWNIYLKRQQPDVDGDEPDMNKDEPDIERNEPDVDGDEPDIDIDEPDVGGDEPDVDKNEPDIDREEPDIDREEPDIERDEPDIDLDEAEKGLKIDCEEERLKRRCNECDSIFDADSELIEHKRTIHRQIPFYCEHCVYQCFRSDDLKRHMEAEHCNTSYYCEQCSFTSSSRGELNRHIRTTKHFKIKKSRKNQRTCDFCGFVTQYPVNLQKHIEVEHEGKRYPCDQCDLKFKGQQSLRTHIQNVHEQIRYKCAECDTKFTLYYNLLKHKRRIASKQTPDVFSCDICPKIFCFELAMRKHKKKEHSKETERFPCDQCNKVFYNQQNINRHKKSSHVTVKP